MHLNKDRIFFERLSSGETKLHSK